MRRSLLLLAALALPSLAAHANTITAGVYNLQNSFVGGSSVTGTVTINSAGDATSANLTYNNAQFNNPGFQQFSQVSFTSVYNGLSQNYLSNPANSGQLALYFNTASDASGYFNLCLGGTQCGTSSGTVDPSNLQISSFYNSSTRTSNPGLSSTNFSSGYLISASNPTNASTPEPASFILLGTGMVGVLGVGGRKLFQN